MGKETGAEKWMTRMKRPEELTLPTGLSYLIRFRRNHPSSVIRTRRYIQGQDDKKEKSHFSETWFKYRRVVRIRKEQEIAASSFGWRGNDTKTQSVPFLRLSQVAALHSGHRNNPSSLPLAQLNRGSSQGRPGRLLKWPGR